jgi:site-specific DNA recombinase
MAHGWVRNALGKTFNKNAIYKLLRNRTYVGDAVHKGTAYPGEHKGIISKRLFDNAQAILAENASTRGGRNRRQTPALLKGLIFGPTGRAIYLCAQKNEPTRDRQHAGLNHPE